MLSAIIKLAHPNADCGVRIAEFGHKNRRAEGMAHGGRLNAKGQKFKAPAYAEATAGKPAYGITQPSAGKPAYGITQPSAGKQTW